MAVVPTEDPACLAYCIREDEEASDCLTLGSSDSNIEEIRKPKVKAILKELAELKRREAECYDKLADALPDMTDSEVVLVGKKVKSSKLPSCVEQMYHCIGNLRNIRVALAMGE